MVGPMGIDTDKIMNMFGISEIAKKAAGTMNEESSTL